MCYCNVIGLCQQGVSFDHSSKSERIKRSLSYDGSSVSKHPKGVGIDHKQTSLYASGEDKGWPFLLPNIITKLEHEL